MQIQQVQRFSPPRDWLGLLVVQSNNQQDASGGHGSVYHGQEKLQTLERENHQQTHTCQYPERHPHPQTQDMYVRAVILQRAASGAHSFLLPPHSTPHTAHRTPHTAPHTEHSLSCIHKNTHTRDPCTLLQRAETDTAGRKGHRTVLSTGGTSSPMMVDPHPTPPLSLSLSSLSQSCRTCPTSKNSPHTHHTDR